MKTLDFSLVSDKINMMYNDMVFCVSQISYNNHDNNYTDFSFDIVHKIRLIDGDSSGEDQYSSSGDKSRARDNKQS